MSTPRRALELGISQLLRRQLWPTAVFACWPFFHGGLPHCLALRFSAWLALSSAAAPGLDAGQALQCEAWRCEGGGGCVGGA